MDSLKWSFLEKNPVFKMKLVILHLIVHTRIQIMNITIDRSIGIRIFTTIIFIAIIQTKSTAVIAAL